MISVQPIICKMIYSKRKSAYLLLTCVLAVDVDADSIIYNTKLLHDSWNELNRLWPWNWTWNLYIKNNTSNRLLGFSIVRDSSVGNKIQNKFFHQRRICRGQVIAICATNSLSIWKHMFTICIVRRHNRIKWDEIWYINHFHRLLSMHLHKMPFMTLHLLHTYL